MRLAILISLCVLIIAFSIGSVVVYENWRRDRYDPLIIEAATKHHVHPALLKAIADVRGRFNYRAKGEKGEIGLLQVPHDGVTEYETQVMKDPAYDFGWVCVNKAHPPHKAIKYELARVCNICRTPLIRGECYPEQNIEIGAWYLAELTNRLKADVKKATGQAVEEENVIPFLIAAYCLSEKTVRDATRDYRDPLPQGLHSSIRDVLDAYDRYKRKGLS